MIYLLILIVVETANNATKMLCHIWFTYCNLKQNGWHFLNHIFKLIFYKEEVCISSHNSLKFVMKNIIHNRSALVYLMAGYLTDTKQLSESMMVPYWWLTHFTCTGAITCEGDQGLYSLNGKTSYRKISWSLEAVRFRFKLLQSLWNLAGTSAALLPRCLSNFRAIRPLQHPISRLRDFTRFSGKTSYRLVNRGPEWYGYIRDTDPPGTDHITTF